MAEWVEFLPGDCALIMTGEEMLYRCSECDAKYADVEGYTDCPHLSGTARAGGYSDDERH